MPGTFNRSICSRPLGPVLAAHAAAAMTCGVSAFLMVLSSRGSCIPRKIKNFCLFQSTITAMDRRSRLRAQPDQFAVIAVGQHIDEPVRPLAHVPDTLSQVRQQLFLRHDFFSVQGEFGQMLSAKGADQQIT